MEAPLDAPPAAAIAEYLKAYELDIRFTLAAGKLLDLAVQHPDTAKEVVHRLWLVHSGQPDIDRLRRRLEGVQAPDEVRAILLAFLRSGGE